MAAYLEEHRKMEKRFQGLELKHIPRGENVEADEITKRALIAWCSQLVSSRNASSSRPLLHQR
jgi:hypothetical protein